MSRRRGVKITLLVDDIFRTSLDLVEQDTHVLPQHAHRKQLDATKEDNRGHDGGPSHLCVAETIDLAQRKPDSQDNSYQDREESEASGQLQGLLREIEHRVGGEAEHLPQGILGLARDPRLALIIERHLQRNKVRESVMRTAAVLYPGFLEYLQDRYGFTETDLFYTSMLLCGFNNSSQQVLTGNKMTSISVARSKAAAKTGKKTKLSAFILEELELFQGGRPCY